jgi:RecB family exonuclease
LLEHERQALNVATPSGARLPMRTSPDDETLTFLTALAAARERLCVSYARADASGSGRNLPSFFFRSVARAIQGRDLTIAEIDAAPCVRRLPAGRLAHDPRIDSLTPAEFDRGLVTDAVAGRIRGVVDTLATFDGADPLRPSGAIKRAVVARRERWSHELTPYDGTMVSREAAARVAAIGFGRERAVSPSRLEMYAQCPYRYYLRYVLGIEPIDEPEALERMDHLERGSLIHAILERFLKTLGRADPPSGDARDRHVALLLQVAADEAKERHERGVTGLPLIWELDRRQIFEDLVRWYDREIADDSYAELLPGAFEAGFGGARYALGEEDPMSSDEPLELRVNERMLLLQGRTDRIDWNERRTRFRVVDYKTGRWKNQAMFDGGRALQLPLYLLAAAKLAGIDPQHGEAEYFFCTSRGEYRRVGITGEELASRREEFEQVLATLAEGAEEGYFAPNPGKGANNCRFCDYKDLCDSRIERIMDRKNHDARAAAFVALRDIK